MTPTALAAYECGTGDPILLLHGLDRTGDTFEFLANELRDRYRLIAPDLRGHGQSASLPGPYSADALAADLLPTLDARGVDRVHVLGHSHGGAVAQVFARSHPERVRSLTLVSTYARYGATWWEVVLGRLAPVVVNLLGTRPLAWGTLVSCSAGGGRRLSREAAMLRAASMTAIDRDCLAAALRLVRQFDSRPWLGTLPVPTLVIAGSADLVVAPRQAHRLAATIPGASLYLLQGAGHELPLSHAVEMAQLITAWLETVEALSPVSYGAHAATVMKAAR